MKKLLFLALAMVLAVSSAFAGNMNVSVSGGYTGVAMTDANNQLQDAKDAGADVTKMGGAYDLGVGFGYNVMPELSLGVKVGYIGAFDGKASSSGGSSTYSASLMPILLDGAYMVKLKDTAFSVGGGLGFGYGIGSGSVKVESPMGTETLKFGGNVFVCEILAKGAYAIADNTAITLDLGYRSANIKQVKATEDSAFFGYKKDDAIKNKDNSDSALDMSGIIANIGVQFGF